MKEVSTSTSWQSSTPLLHTGNVYFVSGTENGKQDMCNLEELMAAETSNSSEGHRYEGFFVVVVVFFRKHSLLGIMCFISKRKALDSAFLVILGHVLSEPKQRGFRDGTPNTKSSVTGWWHPEMTAPALIFTPDYGRVLQAGCLCWRSVTSGLVPCPMTISKGVVMFVSDLIQDRRKWKGQDRVEAAAMLAQYEGDKCWQGEFSRRKSALVLSTYCTGN